MKLTTVLFDLDGTLLPMDEDVFIRTYFAGLAKKLAPHGYKPDELIKAIWQGTMAMLANNGEQTNEQAFFRVFSSIYGQKGIDDEVIFDHFYRNEFAAVREVCGFDESAAAVVRELRAMGLRTVLATNPIFPRIATEKRLGWAGLSPEDFELVTTYENCGHSKPNPGYYRDILARLGVEPGECIMIGNNTEDDMSAAELGVKVYLCPACLINKRGIDISPLPQGTLTQALDYIKTLI